MPADPRDDFAIFEGSEHMFFGLADPFGAIRHAVEDQLRRQVADTEVERIACHDEPKWLTLARRDDGATQLAVSHVGVCFRARVTVAFGYGREELVTTLTFLFELADPLRLRAHFDLHDDAEPAYADDVLRERLLAFRNRL